MEQLLAVPRKLRVLCLHGFRTNQKIMRDQTRDLRRVMSEGDASEFVFLDGPLDADGDSDPMVERVYAEHKPFHEWWRLDVVDAEQAAHVINQANSTEDWNVFYDGAEDAIDYANKRIQALGPFDVVVAFSQGAVLLTILTMRYRKHHQSVPWKLNIIVGGARITAINVRSLFESDDGQRILVPMPSVHIIGKLDPLYSEGHKLVHAYEAQHRDGSSKRLVVEHEGGHRFPSARYNPEAYDAIVRMIQQHCWPQTPDTRARL